MSWYIDIVYTQNTQRIIREEMSESVEICHNYGWIDVYIIKRYMITIVDNIMKLAMQIQITFYMDYYVNIFLSWINHLLCKRSMIVENANTLFTLYLCQYCYSLLQPSPQLSHMYVKTSNFMQ